MADEELPFAEEVPDAPAAKKIRAKIMTSPPSCQTASGGQMELTTAKYLSSGASSFRKGEKKGQVAAETPEQPSTAGSVVGVILRLIVQ